jgi:carbamoyl-phosphate synthase large subunit
MQVLQVSQGNPVLIDQFLQDAIEVDVDAICDGKHVIIAGIMEHIEQAGVHSGDSACSLPPFSLSKDIQDALMQQTVLLATTLQVIGLMNVQFAIQKGNIYVLEINPRASRTVPFVAKATGVPITKIATLAMLQQSLHPSENKLPSPLAVNGYSIKLPVFPFIKFPGVDPVLGPEMKSTGEVMGRAAEFGQAFGKAVWACGQPLPECGHVLISVRDEDKSAAVLLAQRLIALQFTVVATHGTAQAIQAAGFACEATNKVHEGRPHSVDLIKNQAVSFIINTVDTQQAMVDSYPVRRAALQHRICYTTTLSGAAAIVSALESGAQYNYFSLQDDAFFKNG